ncbi:MAG: MBL fold metallo-hydrolase [Clostridia bacterium]|nr:MBL fold metallo-hydrolase [Clostridia bacterium]
MIKLCTLFSGSSGNATFVGTDRVKLLVDAGRTAKDIERELAAIGEDPRELDAVLVTHDHIDHIYGVGVLARRYGVKVVANERTWAAMSDKLGRIADTQRIVLSKNGGTSAESEFTLGDLDIQAFPVPHDAAATVGYSFIGRRGKVTVATDTAYVTDELRRQCTGSSAVLLESNHDIEMLKHGPYPQYLIARIASKHGHMSNDDCAGFITELAQSGTRAFILGHLSKDNNLPELAFSAAAEALGRAGIKLVEYGDIVPPDFFEGGAYAAGIGAERDAVLCVAPRDSHGKVMLI